MGMRSFANETGAAEAPAPHADAPVAVVVVPEVASVPDPPTKTVVPEVAPDIPKNTVPEVDTTVPDAPMKVPDLSVTPDALPLATPRVAFATPLAEAMGEPLPSSGGKSVVRPPQPMA